MMTTEKSTQTLTLVSNFRREPETNLVVGVSYARRDDGRIDWRKMINPRHIVFNSAPKLADGILKAYGKSAYELSYAEVLAEGKEVDDRHLLVLLQGFIEVAGLRGYRRAEPRIAHVVSYPPEAAVCSCECVIEWLPNEEEPDGKCSFGTADATMENTGSWGYLSAIAGNRAFVRAVRQGLEIPILGFDEIAKKDTVIPESSNSPATVRSGPSVGSPAWTLQRAAEENKISFAVVKKLATDKYRSKIEGDPIIWEKWEDIVGNDCMTLVNLIRTSQTVTKK